MTDNWEYENQQKWGFDEDSVGVTGWEARMVMMMDEDGVSELLRVVLYDNDDNPLPALFWFPNSMRLFASSMLEGLDELPTGGQADETG